MNETSVTVIGNLVADPVRREIDGARALVTFRIASTARRWDASQQQVVNGRTSFYSVSCWGQLAENVGESLRKGERAVVSGRLSTREYTGDDNVVRTSVEIDAQAVGHDLAWGTSRFTRVSRAAATDESSQATTAAPSRDADELVGAGTTGD